MNSVSNIKDLVDIFVITVNRPVLSECLKSLKGWEYDLVSNYQPMSKAFNEMIRRASKKYFIQVDEDMILRTGAIARMVEEAEAEPDSTVCVCFDLWDRERERQIQGIKIYRTEKMKQFKFKNQIDCEMDMIRQWKDANLTLKLIPEIVGDHAPTWDEKSTFEFYRALAGKEKYVFNCMTATLREKLEKFKKNPNDRKLLFSLLGLVAGYSTPTVFIDREKGLADYSTEIYDLFKKYFDSKPTEEESVFVEKINRPEISVIMPVYKADLKWLREAIESIINQTFKNFELLIICNGSPAEVKEECDRYDKKHRRVKVLYVAEPNLINALNHGIREARGKYIARQDADDISNLNRFLVQWNYLEQNPDVAVCGTYADLMDEAGNFVRHNDQPRGEKLEKYLAEVNNAITHGSVMGRAGAFKKFEYLPDPIALHIEDYELWLRMIFVGGLRADNIPEYLYNFRVNQQSISRQSKNYQIQQANCQKLKDKYKSYIKKHFEKGLICNKTFDREDLETYNVHVEKLYNLWQTCELEGIPFNIDGLDNAGWEEKPRFWEYSHAVHCCPPVGTVLDAGSGYSLFPALLSLHEGSEKVYSLDWSYKDMRQYQFSRLGINAIADRGDFRELPYPDEFFNRVYCISCLEHFPQVEEMQKALLEFRRVLKPGGKLFITTDYHKDYYDYGSAGWQWSEHTRYFNWDKISEFIISPSGMKLLGNKEFVDETDWGNPPLYGNYTFAGLMLQK